MLPFKEYGAGKISLVFLPFLGGSQREWIETVDTLSKNYRCITADLPGFGAASAMPGYSVSEMTGAVVEFLASLKLGPYVLIGHSMAGKVSAVTARRLIVDGTPIAPPDGLVLVAPSPPGPEPMDDAKRNEMLESLGNGSQLQSGKYSERDRPAAEDFVRANIANPIPEMEFRRTVDDVLLMNPAAWVAWLKSGSKEDWASYVGILDLPTLIVAGTQDAALGPDAQSRKTLPHFSHSQLAEVDCSHLIPLEKPIELASLISTFLERNISGAQL
jgi:pimeloyl-ACP methyl ester carboxylesterase